MKGTAHVVTRLSSLQLAVVASRRTCGVVTEWQVAADASRAVRFASMIGCPGTIRSWATTVSMRSMHVGSAIRWASASTSSATYRSRADVGQDHVEETDIVRRDGDYGQRFEEGDFVFDLEGPRSVCRWRTSIRRAQPPSTTATTDGPSSATTCTMVWSCPSCERSTFSAIPPGDSLHQTADCLRPTS